MIRISTDAIDLFQLLADVADERCGASVLFLGTTRSVTGELLTRSLEYQCYEPMALRNLADLEAEARRRWPILQCGMVHRIGPVPVGQASVAIAVSSPHRRDAFEAGQWLIDRIKSDVPIWKKEITADGGEIWQHPETASPASTNGTISVPQLPRQPIP